MVEERRKGMEEILQRLTAAETHLAHGATRMQSLDAKIDKLATCLNSLRDEVREMNSHLREHCEDEGDTTGRIDALESWRDKVMGGLKIVGSAGVIGAAVEAFRRLT